MKHVQETRETLVNVKRDLIEKIQTILNELKGTTFTEEDELAILFPFEDFAYQYVDMVPLTRIDENGILFADFTPDITIGQEEGPESREEDIPLDYLYIEFLYDLYVKIANYKEGRHISEIEGVEID